MRDVLGHSNFAETIGLGVGGAGDNAFDGGSSRESGQGEDGSLLEDHGATVCVWKDR